MFQLNYRDTRPFYEQIKDNLRQLMVTHSIAISEAQAPWKWVR